MEQPDANPQTVCPYDSAPIVVRNEASHIHAGRLAVCTAPTGRCATFGTQVFGTPVGAPCVCGVGVVVA